MHSSGSEDLRVQRTLDFLSPPNSNPVSPRSDEALIGVGLLFVIHANTGKIFVHSIVPDSPAEKCGCIHVGDALVSIDAQPITSGTSLTELRGRVLGPYSSTVTLGFSRNMFEDERNSHSSVRFSVFLTRESSKTTSIDRIGRKKEALSSERTRAFKVSEMGSSSIFESSAEFQPHPPPARSLNTVLSANGSMSSTSPKQRFSVVGRKILEDRSRCGSLEFHEQQNFVGDIISEQLHQTTSNPPHQLMETFKQQPNQVPSGMFSMRTGNSSELTKDAVSASATDLMSIQMLSIEVQAMDSWLHKKASKIM
jgi:hypothetical protein